MASNDAVAPLPIGFVFAPIDEHIVGCFLKYLITTGPPFPPCKARSFMHNLDIFGPHPPWEIAALLPEEQRNDFYVFTKVKKLSPGRNRRTAENGQGTWKGQSVPISIYWSCKDNSVAHGEKKSFSFLHGKNKLTSHWNLYEYNLLKIDGIPILDDANGRHWVICRVIYNKNYGKKTSDSSGPIQESRARPVTKKAKISQPQSATRAQHGAEEAWNLFDTNGNVGGMRQQQSFVAAQPTAAVEEQEPPPFVDESDTDLAQYLESMLDVEMEFTSPGDREDQDQLYQTLENANAGFNEQETVLGQSSSDNDSEFQHLLSDPGAAVEYWSRRKNA